MLVLVEACLAGQPEQSDVVHDLLVFMAQQMTNLHKRRTEALEDFTLGMEGVLSEAEMEKMGRLWTPPSPSKTDNGEAEKKLADAQAKLGALALRTLDLDEDIGRLNEEQWKWLLKRKLSKPDMAYLTKVYRTHQPPIAALDQRIALLDKLIDQVVYRLYGLTEEERTVVEEVGISQEQR